MKFKDFYSSLSFLEQYGAHIIECDLANGIIKNITKNKEYQCAKFPVEIQSLIQNGGLVNYTRTKLGVK